MGNNGELQTEYFKASVRCQSLNTLQVISQNLNSKKTKTKNKYFNTHQNMFQFLGFYK